MSTYNNDIFEQMPVIGILRNYQTDQIRIAAQAFYEVGFRTLEITMNSANTLESIQSLSEMYSDMNIGAGTVCTQGDLDLAVEAGASFIVSPILDPLLIEDAKKRDLAVFPGALSPSEIYQAWKAGATAVKVFPASVFDPTYLKELRGPLPQIKLLPVGGITLENLEDYFKAGAIGVGMGSGLFERKMLQKRDVKSMKAHLDKVYTLAKTVFQG
ncbi:MAG: bifunctional 4-hydroxy-2-oxoglutarate aldolase/2-dehydro-3-deoxy-phosphogluconate aldolase [Saprospiraceae bacterium]|nr:bifunctional 4-hydroxy-2-oxoglutarate aldolase/2-dehydro-3-deoxy-phosphogluconate aldolase [Saprospiraceae bacterium]